VVASVDLVEAAAASDAAVTAAAAAAAAAATAAALLCVSAIERLRWPPPATANIATEP